MNQYDKSKDLLAKVLETEPSHSEATRLSQRVEAARRAEERKQKAAARRMLGACDGFSEERESVAKPPLPDKVQLALSRMEPDSMCKGVDIAEAAARAAREREAKNSTDTEKLP